MQTNPHFVCMLQLPKGMEVENCFNLDSMNFVTSHVGEVQTKLHSLGNSSPFLVVSGAMMDSTSVGLCLGVLGR